MGLLLEFHVENLGKRLITCREVVSYEVRCLKMKKLAVKLAERSGAMNRIKGKKKLRDLRLKIVESKKRLKTLQESLAKAEGKLLGNSTVGVLSLKELKIVERLGFGGKIYAVQSIVEEEEGGNDTLKLIPYLFLDVKKLI